MTRTSTTRTLSASIAAICLTFGMAFIATPTADATSPRVEPCIWDTGTNLQQYFDISSALVIPPECDRVKVGAPWSTPLAFYVARSWELIPDGYAPTTDSPLDELKAHLTKVVFTVDEGTPQEFTVERSGQGLHWLVADWQEVYPDDPDWLLADVGTHITIHPLPPGTHTISGEFTVDAVVCDGVTDSWDASCIPTGTFQYPSTRTFTVVTRD
jgi:hypothetical protein